MKLTDLLELLEPDAWVFIATGEDVERNPDAELVAKGPLDKLRLADVLGYQVTEIAAGALNGIPTIHILVREAD